MNSKQKSLDSKIQNLVKKMTGSRTTEMTTELIKELRSEYPELIKKYNKYKKEFNQQWKLVLEKMCDEKKTNFVAHEDLINRLEKENVFHYVPSGFDGAISKTGKWYCKVGAAYHPVNGSPSGYVFPQVRMNPNFGKNSPWVFQAIRHDGTGGNYYYTRAFNIQSRQEKFAKVRDLLDKIDKIRTKWLKIIKNETNIDQIAAIMLELLYRFSARIGSEGNGTRHGHKTYGISTLCRKHCKLKENGFTLSYLGKDGVKTKHTFTVETEHDKVILKTITKLMQNKHPAEPLFTYQLGNGTRRPVRGSVVNKLFNQLGSKDCTVHKLRTYHATFLAQQLLDEMKLKRKRFRNVKDAKAALTKIAEQVGKKLNHVRRTKEGKQTITGSTALANYIDVMLQADFYRHYGIDMPTALEKMLGIDKDMETLNEGDCS